MNLRTIIADKKRMMDRSWNDWNEWSKSREKYVSFTERYIYLILFGQYLWAEIKEGAAGFPKSTTGFQEFMRQLQLDISVYEMFEDLNQLGLDPVRAARSQS